jgi:CheY-like chemotaxis protein
VAEDNPVNQKLARRVLEKMGHEVVLAGDGAAAVRAFQGGAFDAVFMDVQMPELDGLDAAREIRRLEDGAGDRVPVFALTAHAMRGDRERCLAAGMDHYLTKPLDVREVAATLAAGRRARLTRKGHATNTRSAFWTPSIFPNPPGRFRLQAAVFPGPRAPGPSGSPTWGRIS